MWIRKTKKNQKNENKKKQKRRLINMYRSRAALQRECAGSFQSMGSFEEGEADEAGGETMTGDGDGDGDDA